jgi:hypothetical protein
MSRLDSETKRKLREMGVASLVDAIEALTLGVVFEERIKIAVDDAHATFTHSKVEGLVRRAGLRYPALRTFGGGEARRVRFGG